MFVFLSKTAKDCGVCARHEGHLAVSLCRTELGQVCLVNGLVEVKENREKD